MGRVVVDGSSHFQAKVGDNFQIRLERPEDYFAVEALTREAFWNRSETVRDICDEHLLVSRLRSSDSFIPDLDFVAELNGQIVGHIIYAHGSLVDKDGAEHDLLTFGPISVTPELQRMGIGQALINHSLKEAARLGYRGVVIYGYPEYYPRCGFQNAADFGITTPKGENHDFFMARPLYPGALDDLAGSFHLDPVYETLSQADAKEFDLKFE